MAERKKKWFFKDPVFFCGIGFIPLALIGRPVLDETRFFFSCLQLSFAAWVLYLGVLLTAKKNNLLRMRKPLQWASVMAGGGLLISCYVFFGMLVINSRMDNLPPVYHESVVQAKRYTHGNKGGPHYNLEVSSWRPGYTTERIEVDRSSYDRSNPHKTILAVWVKSGRLGFPWVIQYGIL